MRDKTVETVRQVGVRVCARVLKLRSRLHILVAAGAWDDASAILSKVDSRLLDWARIENRD